MSDNIQSDDRQVGVEMSWHKKTEVVPEVTFERAFPFKFVQAPVFLEIDGKMVAHGKWYVPVGSDTLRPVGNGQALNQDSYKLKPPQEIWDFMQEITRGTKSKVVSAGTVSNRSKYFVSMELEELQTVKFEDGSDMKIFLNGLDSCDKTINYQLGLAGFKMVCENTLLMSYFLKVDQFRFRHSKNMDARIEEKKAEIEAIAGYSAIVKATFDKLIKKPCSIDRARNVYAGFVTPLAAKELSTRGEHVVDSLLDCFQNGPGNGQNNEFSLLGALTDRFTHGFPDSKKEVWSTFESSEFGAWANRKQEFSRLLTHSRGELAEVEKRGRELVGVKVSAKA